MVYQTTPQYPLKEERRKYQDVCDKGEGGDAGIYAYILQRFVAGFMKVTSSHEEQTSPTSAFLGRRKCNNWAHKIFS